MTSSFRTPEKAERICALIVDGYTLRQVAREVGVASPSAIINWVREDEAFHERYARAKTLQAERLADELIEISDDGTNDWMAREGDDGERSYVLNGEHVQRSRLRVDTRKWLLAKMLPKVYGERVALAGDTESPLRMEMTIEDRRAAARAILDQAFGEGDA